MFPVFLYFFTELKTYHLTYFIYKYDVIDIADPLRVIWTNHYFYNCIHYMMSVDELRWLKEDIKRDRSLFKIALT